ncbi:MAG: hypothetical protein HC880_14050 [Bacteroidia bacterium]|nr:hypothetical protein [Bacteroidia bacterium]
MVFSICEWGLNKPWLWAKNVGHLWRTTGDIRNNWDIPDAKEGKVWGGCVVINLDMQEGLAPYTDTDHWNDPDMLEIGNGVLTLEEAKSQLSLWAVLAAPLMAGNDLRNMDEETRKILTNTEIIRIAQDSLGIAANKSIDEERFEVFVKPLQNNKLSLCFFNRENNEKELHFDWKNIKVALHYQIRDVWEHREQRLTNKAVHLKIPRHGVVHFH